MPDLADTSSPPRQNPELGSRETALATPTTGSTAAAASESGQSSAEPATGAAATGPAAESGIVAGSGVSTAPGPQVAPESGSGSGSGPRPALAAVGTAPAATGAAIGNTAGPEDLVAQIDALCEKLKRARAQIEPRFIGQRNVVELALVALLCGGHGLLVGLPGLGKTRLVETLSSVMGLGANRIQFTPDLMPADILGSEVLDTASDGTRSFRFVPGPIFCQLLMADEINRASPRTQSALLQAMQERTVTVAGIDRPLDAPFHVLATQNPIEQEGTYPLPEAQLDRFLVQIDVEYPDRDTEREILLSTTGVDEARSEQVFAAGELVEAQRLVRRMPVGESVVERILDLVRAFRPEEPSASARVRETVAWGPGPRAAQALMMCTRARALLDGRFAPDADDVAEMARPALSHRMALSFSARARGDSLADLISETVAALDGREAAA